MKVAKTKTVWREHRNFVPLVAKGRFLKRVGLDHYEEQMANLENIPIVGYIYERNSPLRVVLDTRKIPFVPFDYIHTWADRMHKSVRSRIWANDARRTKEAEIARKAKELRLSTPGTRVKVFPTHYSRNFYAQNGIVIARNKFGNCNVRLLESGQLVTLDAADLHEGEMNSRIYALRAEIGACIKIHHGCKPPFGPTRPDVRTAMESRAERNMEEMIRLTKEEKKLVRKFRREAKSAVFQYI